MGPLNMPWLTFCAVIVTVGSIVAAVIWALADRQRGEDQG